MNCCGVGMIQSQVARCIYGPGNWDAARMPNWPLSLKQQWMLLFSNNNKDGVVLVEETMMVYAGLCMVK
jgi:hypothetical protein